MLATMEGDPFQYLQKHGTWNVVEKRLFKSKPSKSKFYIVPSMSEIFFFKNPELGCICVSAWLGPHAHASTLSNAGTTATGRWCEGDGRKKDEDQTCSGGKR